MKLCVLLKIRSSDILILRLSTKIRHSNKLKNIITYLIRRYNLILTSNLSILYYA